MKYIICKNFLAEICALGGFEGYAMVSKNQFKSMA